MAPRINVRKEEVLSFLLIIVIFALVALRYLPTLRHRVVEESQEKIAHVVTPSANAQLDESVGAYDVQQDYEDPVSPVHELGVLYIKGDYVLEEVGNPSLSTHADWWLNSGAYFYVTGGIGNTVSGSLAAGNAWVKRYYDYNPESTDDGIHPQNIFRLISRVSAVDSTQEACFSIEDTHVSAGEKRNQSNGLLFMSRYQDDGDTLYYAGIRVDGHAVIKRKYKGEYETLAEEAVFGIDRMYDRDTEPQLLPEHLWVGIKTQTNTNTHGQPVLTLWLDPECHGHWDTVFSVVDTSDTPVMTSGNIGIRTDFMDVSVKEYKATYIPDGTH